MLISEINRKIVLLGVIIVLISTVWVNPLSPKNIIETKEIMLHITVFGCTLLTLIYCILFRIRYSFHILDAIVSLFVINLIITYNFQQNLSPERLLYILQLYIFWWSLRIISNKIYKDILFLISLLGGIVGFWGVLQILDFLPSSHHLFPVTGGFYNPGPYGGFLAMCLVVTLGNIISVDNNR